MGRCWRNLAEDLKGIRVTARNTIRALLLLAALIVPAGARAACVATAQAIIPIRIIGASIVVPVEVNGIAASFMLDTGADRSVVTPAAVQRLRLLRDQWVGTAMLGVGGGNGAHPNANPHSLTLGGVPLVRRTINHDNSLAVAVLPRARAGDQVLDGLLGRDFLSLFDLDLDMFGGSLTLYRVQDCAGRFLPWRRPYRAIPVVMMEQGHALLLAVAVDGRPLRAMLDTGANASLLGRPGIVRMGLTPASLASDPTDEVSGLGPRVITMRRHQFRSLRVGNQTIDSPEIWVEPLLLSPPFVDMLLGADWLAGRRIWISYATQQMFVAGP